MDTHNICFHGKIRKKYLYFLIEKKKKKMERVLSGLIWSYVDTQAGKFYISLWPSIYRFV